MSRYIFPNSPFNDYTDCDSILSVIYQASLSVRFFQWTTSESQGYSFEVSKKQLLC